MLAGIIMIFCILGIGAILITRAMGNFEKYYNSFPNNIEENKEEISNEEG